MTEFDKDQEDSLLATLVFLMRRARKTQHPAELRFLLVNETHSLIQYRQAAYFSHDKGIETLSGITDQEKHSPYIQWLNNWFKQSPDHNSSGAFTIDLRSLSDNSSNWRNWLPAHLVIVPIADSTGYRGGYFLLARDSSFSQSELTLLEEWIEAWADRYHQIMPNIWYHQLMFRMGIRGQSPWLFRASITVILIATALLPVKLSILAPAELIPYEPAIIRSPMDGVIEKILVEPNQRISKDDALFEFDRVSLESRLDIAHQTLLTSETEYRQMAQQALFDKQSKAQLPALKSIILEKKIDVEYLQALNNRSTVFAPRDGLIIMNEASEWVGRPIVTGERILIIADENKSQIEAWVSPSDMINFAEQSLITLYLSADPLNPVTAELLYLSRQPELRPDGNYAYRLRASLLSSNNDLSRIGLKGTARIDGEYVSLFYWVFRRPWAAFRGWIGL